MEGRFRLYANNANNSHELNGFCLIKCAAGLDGIDGHRTLGDKAGLAGKRDIAQDDDFRTGLSFTRVHELSDFLS